MIHQKTYEFSGKIEQNFMNGRADLKLYFIESAIINFISHIYHTQLKISNIIPRQKKIKHQHDRRRIVKHLSTPPLPLPHILTTIHPKYLQGSL